MVDLFTGKSETPLLYVVKGRFWPKLWSDSRNLVGHSVYSRNNTRFMYIYAIYVRTTTATVLYLCTLVRTLHIQYIKYGVM